MGSSSRQAPLAIERDRSGETGLEPAGYHFSTLQIIASCFVTTQIVRVFAVCCSVSRRESSKSLSPEPSKGSEKLWAPLRYLWVQHLHEEMADFPYGESSDMHDAAVWGLLRIRRGGFRIATDGPEEEYIPLPRRQYY